MITFTFTIQLEPADLIALAGDNLQGWLATLAAQPPPPGVSCAEAPAAVTAPDRKPSKRLGRPPLRKTHVLGPDTAASPARPQIAAIPPATAKADRNEAETKRAVLVFAEFDKAVRAEMKRLSMDGRMPGYKLWDSERSDKLPTLSGVIQRYRLKSTTELAAELGLQPPLHGNVKPAVTEGGDDGDESY